MSNYDLFGEHLFEKFKEKQRSSSSLTNVSHDTDCDSNNVILNIFSGAVLKFEEANKKK